MKPLGILLKGPAGRIGAVSVRLGYIPRRAAALATTKKQHHLEGLRQISSPPRSGSTTTMRIRGRFGIPQTDISTRASVAQKVQLESESITQKYAADRGATSACTFYEALPPLTDPSVAETCPSFPVDPSRKTRVVNSDSFEAARTLIFEHGASESKVAVLNLASDLRPGGGWEVTLCETQEEALCYSSTLFSTLDRKYYPWDNDAASGIFSPGVVVYRDTLMNELKPLPEDKVIVTGVITVAAPRYPRLDPTRTEFAYQSTYRKLREKIRAVYRMAAINGRTNLVLGAMGCGAYGCPPKIVAKEMIDVLGEDEFAGWFERVWWAVIDPMGEGNTGEFGRVCDNIEIRGKE